VIADLDDGHQPAARQRAPQPGATEGKVHGTDASI
jgi:hypothetical protein